MKAGHEVHLLCQDHDAGELDFVDAVGRFDGDRLEVEMLREPVRCTAYLPDIEGVLPVYVADRYERFQAVTFSELDDAGLERYLEGNVAAVRAVAARAEPGRGARQPPRDGAGDPRARRSAGACRTR